MSGCGCFRPRVVGAVCGGYDARYVGVASSRYGANGFAAVLPIQMVIGDDDVRRDPRRLELFDRFFAIQRRDNRTLPA